MFATLLEPQAFAEESSERMRLVATLGGPFFSADEAEARTARANGTQIGLILDAHDGSISTAGAANVRALAPEIVALRCSQLVDATVHGDPAARAALLDRLAASLNCLEGTHRMLIAVGGMLAPLRVEEWRALPAESVAIDPLRDPDAWRAAATLPGDRGLVLGLIPPPGEEAPEGPEVLLWAIGYAASLGGRGGDRVGVAGLPHLPGDTSAESSNGTARAIDRGDATKRVAALVSLLELVRADAATRRAHLDPRAMRPATRPPAERGGYER